MIEFLESLLEPGPLQAVVEVLLGVLLSFAVDWIPGFTELSARAKRLYWLIVPLALPVAAVVILSWLSATSISGDVVFHALTAGILVFLGSQASHARKL